MKKQLPVAYYHANNGVYYQRRLSRATKLIFGSYLVVFGLAALMTLQGLRVNWGRPSENGANPVQVTARTVQTVAPVAATTLPATTPVPQAPVDRVPFETAKIGEAVQLVLSKPPAATWSIAVYDLGAHQWIYRTNANDQMSSASLYKLYAAYGLSKKLPFSKWSTTMVGGQDLQTCVDQMIRQSDNTCGEIIGAYVGWKKIDVAIRSAGFTGTALNQGTGPVTTAEDTTRFMSDLYDGKLFDAETTEFIKTSLQKQLYRSAIPAGCSGCTTYNKTGNEKGVAHDSAIVVDGSRTYAVTIMSEGGNYAKIASVERAIQAAMVASAP